MEIRLDQLGERQFAWREAMELTRDELAHEDLLNLEPVDCRGTVDVTQAGFVLRLRLAYRQTVSCVRCLGAIESEEKQDLDLLVVVRPGEETTAKDEETGLSEEDLGVLILGTPKLDTRPLVIEQAQLGLPMKPLCKSDCAGLCSRCGADLNRGPCECEAEVDPRWAALKSLS